MRIYFYYLWLSLTDISVSLAQCVYKVNKKDRSRYTVHMVAELTVMDVFIVNLF